MPLNEQPNYIIKLNSLLNVKGVNTVNTLEILNNKKDELLYHLDDTHWNSNGVSAVVNRLANKIQTIKNLNTK